MKPWKIGTISLLEVIESDTGNPTPACIIDYISSALICSRLHAEMVLLDRTLTAAAELRRPRLGFAVLCPALQMITMLSNPAANVVGVVNPNPFVLLIHCDQQ